MQEHWSGYRVPPMHYEALYGDRVVRCFEDRPTSFYDMFAASRAARASQDAVVCEGRRWSYAQTDAVVTRIATGLAARGVVCGERVLLFIGNRPEFVFVLLALQRLGAIAVPVGVREQRPGLTYIANQCGARTIVLDSELADRIPDLDDTPELSLRVVIGGVDRDSLAALASEPGPAQAPASVRETDVAVILYTSGTTGNPKGAMLTHLNIAHSVLHYQACMRLQPDDRSALAVPASHVTGLIAIIAAMLKVGGAIIIVPAFKAGEFLRLLEAERVSHTLMVPAMYNLCLLNDDFNHRDLDCWRIGGYGGAPMPVATIDALAQRLPALILQNAYGATETTSPVTMMPAGLTREHADSVGIALPAADIRVMDDLGLEVASGEPGELWIGGPMVVPGYWGNPEATAASFTAGYWHSGDIGSVDTQGFVRVLDRKKDMLNRGGFKIYSAEVESVLMALPGVLEAAIIGQACPVLGERVHAYLHAPGVLPDDTAVKLHCRSQLADYKVPETITWSAAPLPRNANGKVMKRLLRQA
jgi:O-succinylbenzoic acid--CoA ligase